MTLHWIELDVAGRLAIMARPRAHDWLEDEIAMWKREGVDVAVSLLEQHEVVDLELQDEADVCRKAGIEFLGFLSRTEAFRHRLPRPEIWRWTSRTASDRGEASRSIVGPESAVRL